VAGLLGIAAVGAVDPSLLLYPGYFDVVNAGLAGVIVMRCRFLTQAIGRAVPGERLSEHTFGSSRTSNSR